MNNSVNIKLLEREQERVRILENMIEEKTRELYLERERLRSASNYFSKVIETMTTALMVVNSDLVIETSNCAATELFGYCAEEMKGMNLTQLMTMREISRFMAARQGQGGASYRAETNMTTKAGKIIPVLITASIMQGATADEELIVCMALDMSEQKALQGQVVQSQKLESVGQLAAGIAHELNTPIQYIRDNMCFLEGEFAGLKTIVERSLAVLQMNEVQNAYGKEASEILELSSSIDINYLLSEIPTAIQQTKDGAESVARIVKAMKEFSHPGTSEKINVDVNRLLESVATISKNEWKYAAQMKFDLDPQLPHINCYAGELSQAILNVLVNAAHAVADANKTLSRDLGEIVVSTAATENDVIIRVADNGLGIPEKIRERVFEPFFTTKEVGRGTGQGLSIVYATIVKKHGGTLEFSTTEGEGTTFTIRLPRQSDRQPEHEIS